MTSLALFPVHDHSLADAGERDLLDGGTSSVVLEARDVDLDDRIHGLRKLGDEHHPLDVLQDVELVGIKALEVRLELVEGWDRVGVAGHSEADRSTEVLIDDGDAWLPVVRLEVVPDVRSGGLASDSADDALSEAKADVAHGLAIEFVPDRLLVSVCGGARLVDDLPLSLCQEVGLHGHGPLEVVGAREDTGDSSVERV